MVIICKVILVLTSICEMSESRMDWCRT